MLLSKVRAALLAVGLAVFAVSPPALAQSGLRQVPLGFCALSSLSSVTSLSACSNGIPNGVTYAVICAYVSAINYRDDGVAPTSAQGTGGQGISAGSCIPYNATFTALQFIQQSSGAILGITFYR